jgi:hypothetical protein
MICNICLAAGNANKTGDTGTAIVLHQQCKGDCPCQHKVGPGHVRVKGEKTPLIQTQSP